MLATILPGVLLRLLLCALFFYVARYALQPDSFAAMLGRLADRFDKPRDAFENVSRFRIRFQQVCYLFSALYLIFAGTFLYHNVRRLEVTPASDNSGHPYPRRAQPPGPLPYGLPAPNAARPVTP